ncbi:MAG: hypothetical protein AB7N76_23720 [Planctomycetota bacterium]
MREEQREGFLVIEVAAGDRPEAILERLRAARGEAARIVLDLRAVEGLGLYLTPGHMLPPALWEQVGETFGVPPEDRPLDPQLRLVLDADGIRSAGYMGYDDYWLLCETLEEAVEA